MVNSYFLKDGQYFDHDKGEFRNGDISIIDGKISLNGSSQNDEMKTINCRDKFIVPGFFDCHVHLNWSGSSNPIDDTIKDGSHGAIIRAYRNSMKSLASGITNLVDVGSFEECAVLNYVHAIERVFMRVYPLSTSSVGTKTKNP